MLSGKDILSLARASLVAFRLLRRRLRIRNNETAIMSRIIIGTVIATIREVLSASMQMKDRQLAHFKIVVLKMNRMYCFYSETYDLPIAKRPS